MWTTVGPHNHGLARLWRFRDGRLETAYRQQCDAWGVHLMLVHTFVIAAAFALSCSSYIGYRLTPGFWLFCLSSALSFALGLGVCSSAVARRHAIPLHAAYCCVMAAVAGAMVFLQFYAWSDDTAARWPPGLPPNTTEPLQLYTQQTLIAHSMLSGLVWTASQWIPLAVVGLNGWSLLAYGCTLCTYVACVIAAPAQTVGAVGSNILSAFTVFLAVFFIGLVLERLRRSNFLAQTQLAQELRASQLADSILNHTLKNILADVAANLEVFLSGAGEAVLLEDCIACLRRGMQSCKERQVYLKLAAGEYQPVPTPVRLKGLAQQLVAGRPITVQAPDVEVLLDATLMALILENAISNAFRHGCPENPDVHFIIAELSLKVDEPGSLPCRRLQFTVSNAAHPERPPLTQETVQDLFLQKGMPQLEASDGVSFHIGLSHCILAAKCGGIDLTLRQEGDRILFTASLRVPEVAHADTVARGALDGAGPPSPATLSRGLCFCCVDDSPAAQRLLAHHIQRSFPGATVHCFGASEADIARFLSTAVAEADVVILDQHLDSENVTTYGTDLVRQLVSGGYAGLACIRSASDSPEDRARYAASGAHCTLGKDLLGSQMAEELAAAYARHVAPTRPRRPGSGPPDLTLTPTSATPVPTASTASSPHSAPWPARNPGPTIWRLAELEVCSEPSPPTPHHLDNPQLEEPPLSLPGVPTDGQ